MNLQRLEQLNNERKSVVCLNEATIRQVSIPLAIEYAAIIYERIRQRQATIDKIKRYESRTTTGDDHPEPETGTG